ncbi:hypothetical protein HPB51_018553 [Rhipicephalus microplus]|uniref:CNH domain-containing protein n=1 Tax=Rhipicephalus microplus TaxID=6941 RepID=A0A9J6F5C7_RHIMP|nr:hypothetical protein HPB51_018553 [Rhipicephalus microplus]
MQRSQERVSSASQEAMDTTPSVRAQPAPKDRRDSVDRSKKKNLVSRVQLGVFVDADGRRTRGDLKWSRLPLAFAYKSPHLFIQHLNSIEILEIKARGAKESGLHRIVLVSNPRFLGLSSLGSMYLASFHSGQLEVISVNATASGSTDQMQLPSSRLENSEAGESDEMQFSFTSSVVEALEE